MPLDIDPVAYARRGVVAVRRALARLATRPRLWPPRATARTLAGINAIITAAPRRTSARTTSYPPFVAVCGRPRGYGNHRLPRAGGGLALREHASRMCDATENARRSCGRLRRERLVTGGRASARTTQ
ncbi:Os01g0631301 [Oryza sativa Japonica Group]|uniref:Os01g0631301 protein n=1 Tax=Oryza sativa subsp. japonica TaxID=39947 RepID=A0A0N7KDD3_ORYSJ|nr:Os01g0631301 [Oryza sativa Japonica Group]